MAKEKAANTLPEDVSGRGIERRYLRRVSFLNSPPNMPPIIRRK